ncbi:MAG: DUF4262 domain-containing protein [Actinomycetota bacterium]
MTDKDVAGEHYDMISEIIDRCGVMVQWVGAGADTPAFAYTVGLAKLDHPELIIFGLSLQTAQGVLNSMGLPVVAKTRRWGPGRSDDVFSRGVPALLVEVRDSADYLLAANSMFAIPGQGPLPALQVLYPDAAGLWPWQKGSTFADQPVLGPVPAVETGNTATSEQ